MSDAGHDALDRLFAAYRRATSEVEASRNFLPELWARIDAQRTPEWLSPLKLWATRLTAASAAAAALMVASSLLPTNAEQPIDVLDASYEEVLTVDSMDEHDGALWILAGVR